MFSFINPWFILGAVFTLLGVYSYGHHSGYQERVIEDQIEIARLNDEARNKEIALTKNVNYLAKTLTKARDEIKTKQADINTRIDAGELRFPSGCSVQTGTDAGTTTGDRNTNGSQSDRQAIKDIVEIAADGDRAITQLNACINTYNKVRDTLNER
jgi:hypothetical protein